MRKLCFLLVSLAISLVSASAQVSGDLKAMKSKSEVAVLVIDMQNDFVLPGAVLCVDGAAATIPAIQDLLKYGRSKGWNIVHVIRDHMPSGYDVDAPRIKLFTNGKSGYCLGGTKGAEIVDGLKPETGDIVITKTRNSGFFNTNLDLVLRRLGVKTVVIAGTQYPNCVRGTAADAMSYDYETIICTDACSAKTKEVADANIFDMKNMGIQCLSLDEIKKTVK